MYGTPGETWHRGSLEIGFRCRRRIISLRRATFFLMCLTIFLHACVDGFRVTRPERARKRAGNTRLFIADRAAKTEGSPVFNALRKPRRRNGTRNIYIYITYDETR